MCLQVATFELNACLSLLFFTLAGQWYWSSHSHGMPCPVGPKHDACSFTSHTMPCPLRRAVLFWLLAAGVEATFWERFAGWWGLVVAGIAWYIAAADVINEQFKRVRAFSLILDIASSEHAWR